MVGKVDPDGIAIVAMAVYQRKLHSNEMSIQGDSFL